MNELITTIFNRPYVFAFLSSFLFLAIRLWGPRRTFLWLVSGYVIAWASEYSSIHNGFPYGEYHYIYENLRGELIIGGVPFFDSLSYPFLIFAGFAMAGFILNGNEKKKGLAIFIGALFTMLLDVMIDPVSKLGSRWFLGEIYYYAHPGRYFGVPLTNFGGWFIVPLAVIAFNAFCWRFLPSVFYNSEGTNNTWREDHPDVLYPIFYLSIALFNTAIALWIGAWQIGIANAVIISAIVAATAKVRKRKAAVSNAQLDRA